MITTTAQPPRDAGVDTRIVLSALWAAMVLVFAYVDLFGLFRADVLAAALDGTVGTTGLAVDQVFLTGALAYVVPAVLMVVLSLVLPARANRVVNTVLSVLYAVSIAALCIGETWVYYLVGSGVEVALLIAVAVLAVRWPASVGARAERWTPTRAER